MSTIAERPLGWWVLCVFLGMVFWTTAIVCIREGRWADGVACLLVGMGAELMLGAVLWHEERKLHRRMPTW